MPLSGECLRSIAPAAAMVNEFVITTQNTNKTQLLAREGRKPGAFMNPRVIPMYCFLAWRERIESTHKNTPRWNHIIINYFSI
jgi:hypothetical protein